MINCEKSYVVMSSISIVSEEALTSWQPPNFEGGGPEAVGENQFFLENKVVVNFDFRHGAKKSGQSGHPFRSYGYLWI